MLPKTKSIFETLSQEELDLVEVPTKEEIKEALEKAQKDFDKCRTRYALYSRYR